MMKIVTGLATLLLLFCAFTYANATTISVNDSLGSGYMMQVGRDISGHFDLGAEVSSPYTIDSASVTFYFSDDYDLRTVIDSYTGMQFEGRFNSINYYLKRMYMSKYDEQEEAYVSVNSGIDSGVGASSYDPGAGYQYDHDHAYVSNGNSYTTRYYYKYHGYTGSWSITLNLTTLSDLIDDGVMDFYVGAVTGDFYFNRATLTADINEISDATPTPEPATVLLLSTGLAGLAGFRVRRKKKA